MKHCLLQLDRGPVLCVFKSISCLNGDESVCVCISVGKSFLHKLHSFDWFIYGLVVWLKQYYILYISYFCTAIYYEIQLWVWDWHELYKGHQVYMHVMVNHIQVSMRTDVISYVHYLQLIWCIGLLWIVFEYFSIIYNKPQFKTSVILVYYISLLFCKVLKN